MKDSLKNLLKIKSIVTLALTVLFFILAIGGIVTGENVMTVFTIIIGFYFGTQANKE